MRSVLITLSYIILWSFGERAVSYSNPGPYFRHGSLVIDNGLQIFEGFNCVQLSATEHNQTDINFVSSAQIYMLYGEEVL